MFYSYYNCAESMNNSFLIVAVKVLEQKNSKVKAGTTGKPELGIHR